MILAAILLVAIGCEGANILVYAPVPFKSHLIGFQPLFQELAKRGHDITVITTFPVKNVPRNYEQVVVRNIHHDLVINPKTRVEINFACKLKFWCLVPCLWNMGTTLTELLLSLPEIRSFLAEDRKYDLVLVESFHQEATVYLGHRYDAPVIFIQPFTPIASMFQWTGNPYAVSYIPYLYMGYGLGMNFMQRVHNALTTFTMTVMERFFYIPRQAALADKYLIYEGYETRPCLEEALKSVSLTLIQSDDRLFSPKTYVPAMVEISGLHIKEEAAQLPWDLRSIMDNAADGVIFFSFGTNDFVFLYTPEEIVEKLERAVSRVPQIIFWKSYVNESSVRGNVHKRNWFPQVEILRHPNCKVFITHGGLHSLMETVNFGVPILGIPLFGDQNANVLAAEERGYGIYVDKNAFTEMEIVRHLDELVNNSKYREEAKKMSEIFRDNPMPPMEKAVYWTEYVIRHGGARHLRSAAVDLAGYQYYLLDVASFLFISGFLFLIVSYHVVTHILLPTLRKNASLVNQGG